MNFEVLKRSHIKRNILIGIIVVLILNAVLLTFTRAKYKITESIPLVNGTINYELSDFNLIGAYIQEGDNYTQVDEIPTSGYEFNVEKSYCTVNDENINATLNYDMATQTLSVVPLTTKGTKCYLYFDEKAYTCKGSACENILANMTEFRTRTDFSTIVTETTTGVIYKSADSSQYDGYGEVYYFAGNPTDNWVQFGNNSSGQPLYWRIIRINGDGTIRLIYNGTSTTQIGDTTMVNISQTFNSSYNNKAYVGYMYTSGQPHGLGNNSSIKTTIDNWYATNLADEAEYLEGSTGFCGDRTSTIINGGAPNDTGGTGTTTAYYGARYRLYTNKTPSLECTYDSDLYTTSVSSIGNQALQYPIGLITADEVAMAGGVYGSSNSSYYLYNNAYYWTMSPYYFDGSNVHVFVVDDYGGLYYYYVDYTYGVRPVINLRSDIQITGTGTTSDPFKVVGA